MATVAKPFVESFAYLPINPVAMMNVETFPANPNTAYKLMRQICNQNWILPRAFRLPILSDTAAPNIFAIQPTVFQAALTANDPELSSPGFGIAGHYSCLSQ